MVANVRGFTPNYQFKLINFDTPRWHTLEYSNWQQLDAMLLSSGVPGVRGEWANNTDYTEGDRVFDPVDGLIYRALETHTSSNAGDFVTERNTFPGRWALQSMAVPFYRGAWQPNVVYYVGDIVYEGAYTYYLCSIKHQSGATFNAIPNWQVIFDTQATVDTVEDFKDDAEAAAIAAAASASQAALSEGNAAGSAGAAATSASGAAASAAAASSSATSAANSATNASTSESNAAGSAASANTSAINANTSATTASNAASAAGTSEANAAGSAAAAASSATSANTSATTATTQAGIATTKAAEASTSATNAAASASNALSSQNAAASSATAANTSAVNAAASEVAAANAAAALRGTSTTSNSIGLGSRTFTTQAGKQFIAGHFAVIANTADPTKWMMCQITSYSGTTLIVNSIGMSALGGTFADWQIGVSGQPGQAASTVAIVSVGDTPPVSPVDNQLWWETDSGEMFLRYNDGSSSQWVGIIGTQGPAGGGGGSGSPGGADKHIQFNDGGVFNGDAAFTFDKTTKRVISTGNISVNSTFQAQLHLDTSAAANAYSAVLFNQSGNTKFAIGAYSGSGPWPLWSVDTYDEANNYVASPLSVRRTLAGIGSVEVGMDGAPADLNTFSEYTSITAAFGGWLDMRGFGNNNFYGTFSFKKTRAATMTPVGGAVINGDGLGVFNFIGSDGTNWIGPGGIGAIVDGAVTTGNIPSALVFYAGATNTPVERLRIGSDGVATFSGDVNNTSASGFTTTSAGGISTRMQSFDPQGGYCGTISNHDFNLMSNNNTRLGITAAGDVYVQDGQFQVLPATASTSPTTGSAIFAGGVGIAGAINVGGTATFKRIIDAVVALTDVASVALDAALGNAFRLLAAGDRTIAVPTNKPAAGQTQKIIIAHEASGANRTLTLTTGSAGSFRFGTDVTGLTATTSGLVDYIGCVYNANDDRWDVVSYSKGY